MAHEKTSQSDLSKGRDLHRVSTKVAIFTPDASHTLIMRMYSGTDRQMYGLAGGHVDAGEHPDDTIVRELDEELGVTVTSLQHGDFYLHENGKIVLGYVGTLPIDTILVPSDPAKEVGVWLTRQEFDNTAIESNYRNLVTKNWPVTA